MNIQESGNRIAHELLASIGDLEKMPSIRQKAEFAEKTLQTVLVLHDSILRLKGYDAPSAAGTACAKCGVKNTVDPLEPFKCPLSRNNKFRVIQVRTVESFFGYLVVFKTSIERSHLLDDLLINFLTFLSISMGNLRKRAKLHDLNAQLQSDIVEPSRIQQTLKESEERYRSLFTNMQEGLAYCKMLFDDQDRPDQAG